MIIDLSQVIIYIVLFLLFLPEMALVLKTWRMVVQRFVSDDDQKLNKSDFKDASTTWSASLLIRAPLALALLGYLDKREVNELFTTECFTTALLLWGINRFGPPAAKREEETPKPATP